MSRSLATSIDRPCAAALILAALILPSDFTPAIAFEAVAVAPGADPQHCALVGGPLERACQFTCLQADLAALGAAEATSAAGLSHSSHVEVVASRASWETYAGSLCFDPALNRPGEMADTCVQALVQERIAVLENSGMQGGIPFYVVSSHSALPDSDAEGTETWRTARHEINSTRMDANHPFSASFNRLMATVDKGYERLRATEGESILEDPYSDSVLSITPLEIEPERITLSVQSNWEGHGAAHGEFLLEQVHYLPELGREMDASDLFAGNGWQMQLAQLVYDEIYRSGYGLEDWIKTPADVMDIVVQPRRWRFERDELVVQFQIYEIGPYAGGAPEMRLPVSVLAPILADDADRYFL